MTNATRIEDGRGASAGDCAELGQLLGLAEPVTPAVFHRAVNDADYARRLLLCREAPAFRDFLLRDAEAWTAPADALAEAPGHSPVELAARAAASLLGWARTGFASMDAAAYEARFNSCLACPHLVAAPDRLVYRLAGVRGEADRFRVCGLCGCVAARKARYPHERCPGTDPDRAGFNRWGQPLEAIAL